jgi:hypothetical protein
MDDSEFLFPRKIIIAKIGWTKNMAAGDYTLVREELYPLSTTEPLNTTLED